jgi:hypothetical protein
MTKIGVNEFLLCFYFCLGNEGNWSWAHGHEPLLAETAAAFWTSGRPNTQLANRDDCVLMARGSTADTEGNPNNGFWWKDTGCVDDAPPDGVEVAPLCQHGDSREGLLATTTTAAATTTTVKPRPPKCLPGWSVFAGHCYLAPLFPKDWESAEEDCATYPGGHLVSLHSAAENAMVNQLVSDLYWIGARSDSPTDFYWTDGSAWDYEGGAVSSSLRPSPKDCLYAGKTDWDLLDCVEYKLYVCKI